MLWPVSKRVNRDCGRRGARAAARRLRHRTTSSAGGKTIAVSLTDAGCAPAKLTTKAGSVTFDVTNGGTGKVSELELKNAKGIILGERENIVSGISGSFTLNLEPGHYVLNCPNGDIEDNGTLVVTGTSTSAAAAAPSPLLVKATTGYRTYVTKQSDELLAGTKQFVAALNANDVAKAKELFGPVRYHYEAIEPVAESFGNLDPADRRPRQRRREAVRVDGLPPDRADPLGAEHDRRHAARTARSCSPTSRRSTRRCGR